MRRRARIILTFSDLGPPDRQHPQGSAFQEGESSSTGLNFQLFPPYHSCILTIIIPTMLLFTFAVVVVVIVVVGGYCCCCCDCYLPLVTLLSLLRWLAHLFYSFDFFVSFLFASRWMVLGIRTRFLCLQCSWAFTPHHLLSLSPFCTRAPALPLPAILPLPHPQLTAA